jgi:hypothetical protein
MSAWLAIAAMSLLLSAPVQIYVTDAAGSLVQQGLAAAVPADAAAFQDVPAPGIRFQMNEAQATSAPWIDSNGWRFRRGIKKASYAKLPADSAPLAAAEAFAFGVDAILDPDAADVQELGDMLRFLKAQDRPVMPVMANIALVDDHSEVIEEVLNMLTRRNLLYDVVSAPDRRHDLTVQIGSKDFPSDSANNPSDFAARVRAKLGDDKRLVRTYGTNTVIAHLTGDGKHARLCLLNYARSRNRQGVAQQPQEIRIRLLGRYRPARFAAYGGAADAALADVENLGKVTEFTVPPFRILAVIDLDSVK